MLDFEVVGDPGRVAPTPEGDERCDGVEPVRVERSTGYLDDDAIVVGDDPIIRLEPRRIGRLPALGQQMPEVPAGHLADPDHLLVHDLAAEDLQRQAAVGRILDSSLEVSAVDQYHVGRRDDWLSRLAP